MIHSINVTGFRAFKHFRAPGPTRVNLLVGKNNAGKTCLLDALEIAAAGGDVVSLLQSFMRRREVSPAAAGQDGIGWNINLNHLFHGHRLHPGAAFELSCDKGHEHILVRCDARENSADRERIAALGATTGGDIPLEVCMTGPSGRDGEPPLPISSSGSLMGSMASGLNGVWAEWRRSWRCQRRRSLLI